MIVIEGPDNAGKTTLANILAQDLSLEVIHSIKPDNPRAGEGRLNWMASNPQAIYDRASCISEAVYGSICRDGSVYGDRHWEVLDNFLHHGPLVIFCCCSKERAMKFGDREDMEGVHENAELLYDMYQVVMGKVRAIGGYSDITFLMYNYEVDSYDNIRNFCEWYLTRLELREANIKLIGERL